VIVGTLGIEDYSYCFALAYQKENVLGTFREEFVTQSLQYRHKQRPEQNERPKYFKWTSKVRSKVEMLVAAGIQTTCLALADER
jgi:hypothetical protein